MKRLRHPIRAIREPFGTAGLIIACVALLAALGGTAFAAAKLNSTQKKEVEKIAKKYAGKAGAPGVNGTNGSPGAAGKDGTNGSPGADGKSIIAETVSTGVVAECNKLGGSSFHQEGSATKTFACNGKEGSPWVAGGTLPTGQTEKGSWAISGNPTISFGGVFKGLLAPISFGIPLASAPTPIYIGAEEGEGEANVAAAITNGECSGTVENPGAGEGFVCVFLRLATLTRNLGSLHLFYNPGTGDGGTASPVGVSLFLSAGESSEPMSAYGTWAVTAE